MTLKTTLFGFAFLILVTLSSCQKSWVCSCNQVDSLTGQNEPWNYQINGESKTDATTQCTQYNGTSGSITTTCSLY